ncbi:MAG: hypothetical protein PHC44_10375 [Lutispora sp.]|nr:hypothetical protein [Lutispora sp.]
MKRLIIIILAIALLTGCSKGKETGSSSNGAEKILEPFEIIMIVDNREISLKDKREGSFDKPFELDLWFNGNIDIKDKDLGKHLVFSPETIKPQVSVIRNSEIDTTRICVEFNETETLPDDVKIILKAGIMDDKGNKLKEEIALSLKREKKVDAYIRLKNDATISSDSGFDFNSYILDDKAKSFEVTFNYPMDRKSVEEALVEGFRYVPEEFMAKVEVDWKDDSNLTVHFSDMFNGQSYPISFNNARTVTGEEYKEFEMNKVFGFLAQESQKVSKIDGKGNIVSDMLIEDEILEMEDISPDGKYAFGYRVLDTGGEFYPVKPILLELQDNGIKKHYLKGIDYLQGVIFGSKWLPDGKSFLVYTSKKIWHYSLNGALQGQPGKVIFEYDAAKMDYMIGAEVSPDGNKIAVFKSIYTESFEDKASKLVDLHYIDLEGKMIETIEDVFYHNSSDGFPIPLKYSWKDNDTIISEGFSQKNDEANIYSISLKDKKAAIIASKASNPSLLGDIMVIRKVEYDKDNGYLVYGDGNILNLKNNNIEDVISGNLTYSVYGLGSNILAYELYENEFITYIYDRTQKKTIKKHQGMIFGADKNYFYILR